MKAVVIGDGGLIGESASIILLINKIRKNIHRHAIQVVDIYQEVIFFVNYYPSKHVCNILLGMTCCSVRFFAI